MTNGNVGKAQKLMKESITLSRNKNKVSGSTYVRIINLQKVKSLNGRWFGRTKENLEKLTDDNILERA